MSDLTNAIKQVCEEKNLDYQAVVNTIELALAAAYRKDYGEKNQNIKVVFDPVTAKSEIYDVKTVVENLPAEEEEEMIRRLNDPDYRRDEKEEKRDVAAGDDEEKERKFNPKTDIQIKAAVIFKHDAKVGDEIMTELPIPESYGRMAAQTAKQVIIQKLREMERDMVLNEFKDKEKEVVGGVVQRHEGRLVFVDLGKAIGILPPEEQIFNEFYRPGERVKVYIKEVREGHKGPEIILSRRSEEILKKIFYLEIPEIANGLVEIKAVAREAGSRSKVAIYTEAENVDPVGSCVGQRGARIQTIISELGGEKVDIIEYDEDPAKFIANALSPAKISSIELDEADHKAIVKVASDKLSLAIGKSGQNVRLAAHLTTWKIDIIEAEGEKKVADSESEDIIVADINTEEEAPAEDNKEE
ncbi:transcription termination/antitermination protein NusA [Candidatus Falkowbacteria bacterium HGW-Falkowbacteria-2]|uniref:Transcription termination/antitermination protein NusA n=1 Tax=Candidatus Falkowbacteria bacterium HGW-Falkowbacteria-2 TaxID=2013769 RepID=A0A2N2E1V0_9BACT|nr:MAG: transcription termination/antitermination protein NusA [Candidatus Falkowbacteria bacterium HGW-Falkowbacteria-2]